MAAALALALAGAISQPWTSGRAPSTPVASVAPGALGPALALNGALGAADRAYAVIAQPGGAAAANPRQGLGIGFTNVATTIRRGSLRVSLSLASAQDSGARRAFTPVAPRARANRLAYQHPGVEEWYLNGPLGLEQGFTVARPISAKRGELMLRIAVSTNGRVALQPGGQGVRFMAARSLLRYGWAGASDAQGHALPIRLSLAPGTILLSVDARGAAYPLRVDPLVREGAKLTGGAEELGSGSFGTSVALSSDGNTALVGAPRDSGFAGAAWVFARSGSAWVQQGAKLTSAQQGGQSGEEPCEEEIGEEGGCGLGASVALSGDGNTAVIGSPRETGACPTRSEPARECRNQGAAWVFTRSGATWTRQPSPLSGGEEETAAGHFGRSVAVSADGNTILIGAPASRAHRGAAWVFTRGPGGWERREPALAAPEEHGEGFFGASAALSADGSKALVGAPGDSGYAGSAWVFALAGQSWTAQGELVGAGKVGEAHFGRSVALSGAGDVALVGGFGDSARLGAAWPFQLTPSGWTGGGKLTGVGESPGAFFGYSVALSADGHSALIGAPGDAARAGAAWLFTGGGTSWSLEGSKLTAAQRGSALFGSSVALSFDGEVGLAGEPVETEPCPTQAEPTRECRGAGAAWPFRRGEEPGEEGAEGTNQLGPRVNGVAPSEGPVAGGTAVTISGSHFSGATAVDFGASSAVFTVNSNNSITAISPAHQPGTVDVTVTRSGASSPTSLHDRFTYVTGAGFGDPAGGNGASAQGGALGFGSAGGGCTLVLVSRKIAVHGARAALKLNVRGSGTCRASARLTVKIRRAHHRTRTSTIANRTVALSGGHTVQVVLTLNSTGRKLLRAGHGRLGATLALARLLPAPSAHAAVTGVQLTLVRSRPAHH